MGLDDFSSEDEDTDGSGDDWEDDWDTEPVEDDEFPSADQMGEILRHHAIMKDVGVDVDGDTLTGDAEDFGMLFALMFLDYPDADPYSLEDPR